QEVAEYYASLDMMAVVFDIDSETATGRPPTPNDYFAGLMEQHPKQFIGFGSVDPWKGRAAVKEAQRCAELGLRGLKFMPNMQQFYANDERFYPLWGTAQELGLVVLFHTGTTGVGAGRPGGGGIKLKFSRPIPYVDDVAADFPDLRIIMAPVLAMAGRTVGDARAQAERLHGPIRLVAQVLSAVARPVREDADTGQGAVRLGLSRHQP